MVKITLRIDWETNELQNMIGTATILNQLDAELQKLKEAKTPDTAKRIGYIIKERIEVLMKDKFPPLLKSLKEVNEIDN